MTATTFNPLETAHDLEAAGFERRQAEAIAKAIDHGDERAATKADLDTAVTGLRSELRADLAGIEARMYRALWIQGGPSSPFWTALRFLPL